MASEREWIGVSDLMSVLMMVFLFIAILFMLRVESDSQQMEQQHAAMKTIAEAYDETRHGLHDALQRAFDGDLRGWGAEILPDGTMRFNRPDALFAVGSSALSGEFKTTLRKFFPRYVAVLSSREWRDDIGEIRIEGHTSSDWRGAEGGAETFIQNAKLSQARAFAVLEYAYQLPTVAEERMWLRDVLRATGVSFSRPVLENGAENQQRSRRVEFHAVTKAGEKIIDILQQSKARDKF